MNMEIPPRKPISSTVINARATDNPIRSLQNTNHDRGKTFNDGSLQMMADSVHLQIIDLIQKYAVQFDKIHIFVKNN